MMRLAVPTSRCFPNIATSVYLFDPVSIFSMSAQMKHRNNGAEPKNALQSDFTETSSMDSDERYLV
jgi:hypothetical protein